MLTFNNQRKLLMLLLTVPNYVYLLPGSLATWVVWSMTTWHHCYLSYLVPWSMASWLHCYLSYLVPWSMTIWLHCYLSYLLHWSITTWLHCCLICYLVRFPLSLVATWLSSYLAQLTPVVLPGSFHFPSTIQYILQ